MAPQVACERGVLVQIDKIDGATNCFNCFPHCKKKLASGQPNYCKINI